MKAQIRADGVFKHVEQKSEMEPRRKKKKAVEWIKASRNINSQHCCESDEEEDGNTLRGPKSKRISASLIDIDNGLEA